MFKLGRPSNAGNLLPYLLNPVFVFILCLEVIIWFFIIVGCWNLFQVFALLIAFLIYCFSMLLHELRLHLSIHSLSAEWISASISTNFFLLDSLDASHLANFCSYFNPLACLSIVKSLSGTSDDTSHAAQEAVHRMNLFLSQQTSLNKSSKSREHHPSCPHKGQGTFKDTPLIWDTGASQGLTPFMKDFIHYEKCMVPVKDVSKTNFVTGIGTVMYKFRATNGNDVFLPGVAFHLPTADIRLLSPQSYHQRWGGSSTVGAKTITMSLPRYGPSQPSHQLEFPINQLSNVPTVTNVATTSNERENIGPLLRSAMVRHSLEFFDTWRVSVDEFDYEFEAFQSFHKCVADDLNPNLTGGQKELLLWHWKLGISMSRIQELMVPHQAIDSNGLRDMMPSVITPKFPTAATCPIPRCASCELARARRRSPAVMKQQAIEEKQGILSANKYLPGDLVSMDQFVSGTPGRLYSGYGREAPQNRFQGGTIFNDAASGAIWVENQVSLGAGETICSKERFEEWLYDLCCIEVKQYHSDNGVFAASEFRDDCKSKHQRQTFSGVGAKHQNGRAERSIQTIMYMARTFMVHVSLHWNEYGSDSLALWPFAVRHAVWLYNRLPNGVTGLSPMEILTGTQSDHRDLLRAHVWGCPVYVLDPKLQDGKKIPKWSRRARQGQFVGFSDEHSSLVANVRHLSTGYVSPQFHIVFDDHFHTVYGDPERDTYTNTICDLLWETDREIYAEDEYGPDGTLIYSPPPLDEVWLDEEDRRDRRNRLTEQRRRLEHEIRTRSKAIPATPSHNPPARTPSLPEPALIRDIDDDDAHSTGDSLPHSGFESEGDPWADHNMVSDDDKDDESKSQSSHSLPPLPPSTPLFQPPSSPLSIPTPKTVRSPSPSPSPKHVQWDDKVIDKPIWSRDNNGRLRSKPPPNSKYTNIATYQVPPVACRLSRMKLSYRQRLVKRLEIGDRLLMAMGLDGVMEEFLSGPLSRFIKVAAIDSGLDLTQTCNLLVKWVHPLFLKAKAGASKADNPGWREAMSGQFADQFWEAAKKEYNTLTNMRAWEIVDRPIGATVLGILWAFKIKRFPDGLIKSFKGRLCARGDQQIEGVDFFETYAPVVQWTTIRLMLILEVLLGLKSKQGDVTAAFLHATLGPDEHIYIEMPLGFQIPGKVLKLKKTLYGLRQSPRAFWEYMVERMERCGMKQSKLDPCLFVGEKVIAVCYVDDLIFWARDEADIHNIAMQLREHEVDLEQETDAAGFLGIRMERDPTTGLLEMKQEGLINRVIEAMGLDVGMINPKWTPAEGAPLVKDSEGAPASGTFSYSSVVGMLLYLSGHSRPDIAYAVNCAARYMFNPRKSHEEALKRIGRYLKATRHRGLIINPSSTGLKIDAYPDADFAGMYGYENPTDPSCVKSRTGYVINVCDCPVLWQSKLQSETALSTMEAEIVALAGCARELIPIIQMVNTMGPALGLPVKPTAIHVSIHEDNAGALILADTLPPQFTPRSKHYHIKTIWFREMIKKLGIKLSKIETVEQLGDIFTKALPRVQFEYLRKKIMGW